MVMENKGFGEGKKFAQRIHVNAKPVCWPGSLEKGGEEPGMRTPQLQQY